MGEDEDRVTYGGVIDTLILIRLFVWVVLDRGRWYYRHPRD